MSRVLAKFTGAVVALSTAMWSFAPLHAAENPIRIGVMAKFAQINGAAILNGAKMAAEEINAAGGIDGRKIELMTYDDQGSASDATLAFQRAVREDGVKAMVGTFLSEIAITLTPWAARLKVPYIVTGAGAVKTACGSAKACSGATTRINTAANVR